MNHGRVSAVKDNFRGGKRMNRIGRSPKSIFYKTMADHVEKGWGKETRRQIGVDGTGPT